MNTKELTQQTHDLVNLKINQKEEVHADWLVQEVINGQGEIAGEGEEFYSYCAREHVYRVVKKVIEKIKQDEESEPDDRQLNLEGFRYVRTAYTITREREQVLVPIELLSNAELMQRADELHKIGLGVIAHAEELRDYCKQRDLNEARKA